jgi:hypothetical protein
VSPEALQERRHARGRQSVCDGDRRQASLPPGYGGVAQPESGIYHFNGTKDFGTTKRGAYMCEKDTAAGGFRAAKNEKHP